MRVFFHLFIHVFAIQLIAQPNLGTTTLSDIKGCNYANGETPKNITVISGSKEATAIVTEILKASPMMAKPEFTLNVGAVSNAIATEQNGTRYIIYSAKFLEELKDKSLTKWSAYTVLAHEIGHHVYRHTFGDKTRQQSHKDELEADDFAARILAHLGANLDETLAGIKKFDTDGESDSHPGPDIREEVMTIAYKEEVSKLAEQGNGKFPFDLDKSCFSNPWNLATTGGTQAEIDEEKVTIKIQLPFKYNGKHLKICLISNDPTVIPNVRTPGSLSGTGENIPYSPTLNITWNYKMEKYTREQAGSPRRFRVYVYDIEEQPKKTKGAKVLWGTIGITGVGTGILGLIRFSDAKHTYNTDYAPEDKRTGDSNWQKAKQIYTDADKKYYNAQLIMAGGAVAAVVGTIFFIRSNNKGKEAKKSICIVEPRWQIEPLLASNALGVGLRMRF